MDRLKHKAFYHSCFFLVPALFNLRVKGENCLIYNEGFSHSRFFSQINSTGCHICQAANVNGWFHYLIFGVIGYFTCTCIVLLFTPQCTSGGPSADLFTKSIMDVICQPVKFESLLNLIWKYLERNSPDNLKLFGTWSGKEFLWCQKYFWQFNKTVSFCRQYSSFYFF